MFINHIHVHLLVYFLYVDMTSIIWQLKEIQQYSRREEKKERKKIQGHGNLM